MAIKDLENNLASGFVNSAKVAAGSGTNQSTSSTNTNLKNGSAGQAVADVQTALGITADGKFGPQTEKAVKDFQAANGLEVDGIVGPKTLAALNAPKNAGSNAGDVNNNVPAVEPAAPAQDTFTYEDYVKQDFTKSDVTNQAWDILQQHESTKPGEWVDPYRDKYMSYLNQYENRDPFSYDFNSDALYQQYKDQYIQQGQMAMMDTMGQAAALTGGYGSSYAQTVGQQAYNQQLNQLNNIMPELYQMAYDRYGQEGQEMLDMFNMYLGLSEQDYSHYQNNLDNWYQEAGRLTDNYNNLYDQDWNQYLLDENTRLDLYSTGRSEAFSDYQTKQNQAFTSSENEKERAFTSSENEKSRNFTATENQKDREASAAKVTAQQTDTGKNTMSYADQRTYAKEAEKAIAEKGVAGLYDVGEMLEREGYSDSFITSWIQSQLEDLNPDGNQGNVVHVGGGGGGTWYAEVR